MEKTAFALIILSCLGSPAFAQVSPAANGGTTRLVSSPRGSQYAFRYSHNATFGQQYQDQQLSIVSGSFAYATRNQEKPFSMDYAGGYGWTLSGSDYQSGQFHRMYLSQGLNLRRWRFNVADSVSYLPASPTTGFSGVPGTGENIGTPNPITSVSQSILTVRTHTLNNTAIGEMEHVLNYATTISIGGTSDYLYFPDDDGINSRSSSAYAYLDRRFSARTSLLGRYSYTLYEFLDNGISSNANTGLVGIRRRVTRNLSFDALGGPQWISSTVPTAIPSMTTYAVNASANYAVRSTSISGSYFHGTNSGGGYLIGGINDTAQGNFLRQFGQNFALGITGGYYRTAAFNNGGVTNSTYGGAQGTWRLGRNMIVFANYTGTGQSSTSPLPNNALVDTVQRLSFGFGISSREQRAKP
jgi:hypothetical protein